MCPTLRPNPAPAVTNYGARGTYTPADRNSHRQFRGSLRRHGMGKWFQIMDPGPADRI